jgi:hypothetical protein
MRYILLGLIIPVLVVIGVFTVGAAIMHLAGPDLASTVMCPICLVMGAAGGVTQGILVGKYLDE